MPGPQKQMPTPEEIISKLPGDYKGQALALAEIVDELMVQKGVIGHTAHITSLNPKGIVDNLKMLYICLYDLPDKDLEPNYH